MEILSYREELKLGKEEREKYYSEYREFCRKRRLTNTTKGATTIAPKLKKPTETIARIVTKAMSGGDVTVVVDGVENIEKMGGSTVCIDASGDVGWICLDAVLSDSHIVVSRL